MSGGVTSGGADYGFTVNASSGTVEFVTNPINIANGRFEAHVATTILNVAGNEFGQAWARWGATLRTDVANALTSDAIVNLGTSTSNGTLDLNGNDQTIGGLIDEGTGTRTVTSASAATLTIDNAADHTYNGVIAGLVSLAKGGAGTQTLTAANTYTGTTDVNAGILEFQNAGATASVISYVGGDININNGSTLQFSNGGAAGNIYILDIADTVNFDSNGGGLLNVVSGINFVVRGATITTAGGAANTVQGSFNMDSGGGATFDVADGTDAVDLVVSATLQNAQGIVKQGAGTMELSGTNTYTGTTAINAGTLTVSGEIGNGGPAGTVTIASGATLSGGGTVNAAIDGAGGSIIEASGNLTLGDSSSSSGFVTAGSLIVGTHTVTLNDSGLSLLGNQHYY